MNPSNEQRGERYRRQEGLVPGDKIAKMKATVIGVGAIGRQVALQLACMGIGELLLVDPDRVEVVNLAPQGFHHEQVGWTKTCATYIDCRALNPEVEIEELTGRYTRNTSVGDAVFCCVDSIETRRFIWESLSGGIFFADGRMSAESIRVLVATDAASAKHYPTTLFQASEAYVGACTAKSTVYCANVAAGMMVAQFAKWLREMPVEADVSFSLLTMELSVQEGSKT